ncbi:NAC domain-containing protein 78-like [Argentina anserina]|uniref:NAC domain-containing protein 78-like n=1 Tax=Argentina anserina TaxID=57926 RepID=UPI0021765E51|nr:NAC domain-containing protein 78-like [Potentilla anserina]
MGRDSSQSLAPGFRFHPTDEELVWYYLERKVAGKSFRFDAISVVDIYKIEPWDLPGKSKLKSRDTEWYFFSLLDRKYGNSSRTNRATEKGYWKTTGKDRPVCHSSRAVGMKKTLVFHSGRAPKGARTNWVMHEYRLDNQELEKAGIVEKDAYVLCRIFQKSGTGPKNGEQYGAPLLEEEWDEEEDEVLGPDEEAVANEVVVSGGPCTEGNELSDGGYIEAVDLDQNVPTGVPLSASHPLNFYHGETSNYIGQSGDFVEDAAVTAAGTGETVEYHEDQKYFDLPEHYEVDAKLVKVEFLTSEYEDNQNFFNLPEYYEMENTAVKDESSIEPRHNMNPIDVSYSLNDPYLNTTENPPIGDGQFLETNDLSNPAIPVEPNSAGFDMLDEYLMYFDADDDISQYIDFDHCEMLGIENTVPSEPVVEQKSVMGETEPLSTGSQHLESPNVNDASSSMQKPDINFGSDGKFPFITKANQMLGSIPAPAAFASEFPPKGAILRLNSEVASSSSVHAGMIRIRDITSSDNRVEWSIGKDGVVNLVFSVQLPPSDVTSSNLLLMGGSVSGKTGSVVMRGWFLFMFFWVLFISISCKIGSYVYAK